MKYSNFFVIGLLIAFGFGSAALVQGQEDLRISEFMALNDGPFVDEDGSASDWLEIHNAGTNTVNLDRWYLTDDESNLKNWRFPATNLPPNGYLVVWASGKDRRTPGLPLHTDFRLDGGGEYLALIRPDGTNVASGYRPAYPPQAPRVSYGIPSEQSTMALVTSGAPARVLIPTDGSLGYTWTAKEFDDSAWTAAQTGVGYEQDGQGVFVPATLAESVAEFSGLQGSNQWFYGYWDKGADLDGAYGADDFMAFPNEAGRHSSSNFWDGTAWSWYAGSPPWTSLNSAGGHPSGNNGTPSLPDHWAVRRYVSETNGPLRLTGRIEHRAGWTYVTATGTAQNSLLYVYFTLPGDGYIDDIKLVAGSIAEAGPNLLPNGDFEAGNLTPWTVSANLSQSALSTEVKYAGNASLRMVASAGGTTQASSIWQTIAPALVVGQTYTLSYRYLPGTNPAPLVVRFSGNWINTTPSFCGDGIVGRIFVDGTQVYEKSVFISAQDYAVTVPASVGSRVDFAIDAGAGNNDNCDASTFTAKVDTADPSVAVVADTVADWSMSGTQGDRNWYYGYYQKTGDPDGVYQATNFIAFPRNSGPHSTLNYWNGTGWDWYAGNPPWDQIDQTMMHPNGNNSTGGEHWVIRRWVSEVSGRITVDWTVAKQNPGGGGVTGRILHNGTQRDMATIAGTDTAGVARSVIITNVSVGDFIDVALDAMGVGGSLDDSADGSSMTAVIRGSPSVSSGIGTDIGATMRYTNSTAYLRIPFVVTNAAEIKFLTLRMKYDDGFIAYLNGVAVASRNAPEAPAVPGWDSTATAAREDTAAVQFEELDLSAVAGLLEPGTNLLAIHGLNISAADGDFLILPELQGASVVTAASNLMYFAQPTPGGLNGPGSTNVGPVIVKVNHTPSEPQGTEDMTVTAEISPTFNPIGSVSLTYRVMFSNEVTVAMADDGQHGDGAAGDGVYGAAIPASASNPGQMIRYFVYATDSRTNGTRYPAYLDAVNSPQYAGTVVADPSIVSQLPVFHWFIQNPSAADNSTGTKCSLFFEGRFYDNCSINIHGQSSQGFPKRSYDVDMNPGHKFVYQEGERGADDLNFLSTYGDKSYMRNMLAYDAYKAAGAGYHWVFAIRVQQNGAFHSVANLMENGDANYIERLGLDPKGALYKMYNQFNTLDSTTLGLNANAEKKTRKNEGNADLVALYNGVTQAGQAQVNYVYDHIDIPSSIGFLAGHVLANDEDCCHKNYYLYCDNDGTGEWRILPWDVDLSFGHTWTSAYAYYDPRIYATNCYSTVTSLGIGGGNNFINALLNNPVIYQMYLRRVRTITDEQLQPPATHPYLLHYETMVNSLAAQMAPEAALDLAKWGTWSPRQTLAEAVDDLNLRYFPLRRQWIYTTLVANGSYIAPQPANTVINFGTIEYNPASRNQAQEYIELANTNTYAVDISDWRISGAVDYQFRKAVVIPANSSLYLAADVKSFRARTTGPRGGQGLFVQGNYSRQLSARGELLQLSDPTGRVVQQTNYPGNPSPAQQYLRVTEIMYHPSPFPGGTSTNAEDYEYIELKNIGPATLNLAGVHFAEGIDFTFTATNSIKSLAPGQAVVLVANQAAFQSRYGTGPTVAGEYTGLLENKGERLRLEDASNEKILEFSYDNQWYEITDGFGFSLVIVDEAAAWETWGLATSWRPSGTLDGTPGQSEPAVTPIPGILINEVLSHTDPPQVDAVELYNPTTNDVSLVGWFLTDDFATPKKYRIPAGLAGRSVIPAGGYAVFTEADFNPTNPPSPTGFAFSSTGDEAYLFSGDATTNLTGYYHGFDFGAAANGVTFGRHVTSVGEEHFVAQRTNTLGAGNEGPRVGPVVISEVMYHPPDYPGGADNQDDEYVELRNSSSTNVALFDAAYATNTWRVRGGVDFDLPPNVSLAPGGVLLVVSFPSTNTALAEAFRNRHGVPANVPLFGPYQGKLDNSSESVKLYRPDAPETNGVPYVLVDAMRYQDTMPWPVAADGTGASLQRVDLLAYGDDPANWIAGARSAGQPNGSGTPPSITGQPTDQDVLAFNTATFTVMAGGSPPLSYQWRRNGTNIPGATNATLVIDTVAPLSDSLVDAVVLNPAGVAVSSNAMLRVQLAAAILSQPQSRTTFPYSNVTFTVVAGSTSSLRYQWQRDGVEIAQATNASYTVANAQIANQGDYTVVVTDAVGPVISAPARLTLILHPVITSQPGSTNVIQGGTPSNAVFRVTAASSTPLRYQWYFNGTNVVNTNNITGATNATLTLSNAQAWQAGDYWVTVADNFGSVTSAVATLGVLAKPAFILAPISNAVVAGGAVSFSAAWTASLPVSHRWTRGSSATLGYVAPFSEGWISMATTNGYIYCSPTSSVLVVTNIGTGDAGPGIFYRVIVTNQAPGGVASQANLTLLADNDRDGLPDVWEAARPGFSTNNAADANADDDGDGMSNVAEYNAGTNPADATSYLKVEISGSGEAHLQFMAVSNRTYTVEFADGLTPAQWQKFGDVLARTNSRPVELVDPYASTNRYYRLVTPTQR